MSMDEASPSTGAAAESSLTRLVVFSVITLGSGWVGLLVDNALGNPHSMEAPGTLLWIMTPLLTGAVMALSEPSLRRSYAASWLPGRLRTYGVALAVFPLSFAIAIAVGWAAGWLTPVGLGAFGGVVAAGVLGTVLPPIVYALMTVPIMICWAPLFTELRILSGSIWPGLVAHSIANLSQIPLSKGGLPITPGWELLVSPLVGVIPNAIILAAGLGLWARRTGRLRGRSR